MRAAPYFPGQAMSTAFAMAGDDASLHFDVSTLTPKQIADDLANKHLTGMLQLALNGLGKPADWAMMYEEFQAAPYANWLARYDHFFGEMGLSAIPPEHRSFHPIEGFYDSVVSNLPPVSSMTLYMTSGTNGVMHQDPEAYRVSQNVNSKVHFAQHAPDFGIPVPDTLVTQKGMLDGPEVQAFFATHGPEIMLKTLGLAGARNVTSVASPDEAQAYVAEYDDDMAVLLQQKLDLTRYVEMTADLRITPDAIEIANVRKLLFADGLWVGNLLGPEVELRPAHQEMLLQVGAYARAQGYVAPEGLNCGVDYFVYEDEIVITEINARWTGGLFPAEMIRLAGAQERQCIAFIDMVLDTRMPDYFDFLDRHLLHKTEGPFAMLPLGFSPIPQYVEDGTRYFTWQIVAGDFDIFKRVRQDELGPGALDTADAIQLSL